MNIQFLETKGTFVCPSISDYKLLLISNDPEITNEEMNRLSDEIVSTPVRSVAAWGSKCSLWDDAIDWAVIAAFPDGIPDDGHVMTTWHENEEISDVLNFLIHTGNFEDGVHVLIVGNVSFRQSEVDDFLRRNSDGP